MPTPASLISGWPLHVGTARLPAASGIAVGEERVFSVVKSFKEDFGQICQYKLCVTDHSPILT